MTHMKPMEESEGEFRDATSEKYQCRKCKEMRVTCKAWDSSCGGYTDYKFTCNACGHYWWIDGPDS